MSRKPSEAIKWAREHRRWQAGYCLQWVRTCFDVDARYLTASKAWYGARRKHRVKGGAQCPRGSVVWWTGGSHGYGHVAVATGNGNCWSSDAKESGVAGKVNIDELTRRWGLNFQGWSEDINGVRVYTPLARRPRPHVVRLSSVQPGDEGPDVRDVQRELKKHMPIRAQRLKVDGRFGPETRKVYAMWQKRCGYRGDDADGAPGRVSLQRLDLKVE